MPEKDQFSYLQQIKLFSSLTSEELGSISKKITIRKFRKNNTILYEEDTNEVMYIILNGKVKVVQTTEDGKELILAIHQSGDFFGEVSLIDGKTAPAMVMALEDSSIALISRQEFSLLLCGQSKILENFLHILCSRLRESWDKIQMLSFNNASQRIKMLFLQLSNEYGKRVEDGTVLDIKLTHQDLANMAGMTRETVTRILDRWQENGDLRIVEKKYLLGPGFIEKAL